MYTPGPWQAKDGEVTTQRLEGRSFRRIAAVQDYGVGSLREVDDANARLIASAPELLAVLIQAIESEGYSLSGPTDTRANEDDTPAWVCNARGIIAEATSHASQE